MVRLTCILFRLIWTASDILFMLFYPSHPSHWLWISNLKLYGWYGLCMIRMKFYTNKSIGQNNGTYFYFVKLFGSTQQGILVDSSRRIFYSILIRCKIQWDRWMLIFRTGEGCEGWKQGWMLCIPWLIYIWNVNSSDFYVDPRLGKVRIIKKSLNFLKSWDFNVVPPGIEPGTQGFSVLCSTNWAMAPCLLVCECKGSESLRCFQIYPLFFASFLLKSLK